MDLGTIIAGMTLLSGVLAFFYKKDGAVDKVGGVGVLLIMLIIVTGSVNIFISRESAYQADQAKRETETLKTENRRAQTTIQLQYLDIEKPFDGGHISFSVFEKSEDFPDRQAHPLGEQNLIIFRNPANDGPIGKLWLDAADMGFTSAELVKEKGRIKVTQEGSKRGTFAYDLEEGNHCAMAGECPKQFGRDDYLFFTQELAGIDGDFHIGLDIPDFVEQPALMSVSKILQNPMIGYFKTNVQYKMNVEKFEKYYSDNINGKIYLTQSNAKNSSLADCKRTATLPIRIEKIEKTKQDIDAECAGSGTCFRMVHDSNFTINACQISEF